MTKLERTIEILKRGWTTSLECAQQGGVLSLSQRITLDIRPAEVWVPHRKGGHTPVPRYEISERWVKTQSGSRVKAWRITKDRAAK